MAQADQKSSPRIIYILGAGRSGTTLLDIILGNAVDAFSCGELLKFEASQGKPHGCHSESETFLFWQRVWTRFLERFSFEPDVGAIHSHHFFPLLLINLISRRKVDQYVRRATEVFNIVACESGKSILIDSSKYAGRALLLSRHCGHQLSIIYIRRNLGDVIRSFQRKGIEQPTKTPLQATLYYLVVNLFALITKMVVLQRSMCITIQYEDLLNDPIRALESIEQGLNLDLSNAKRIIAEDRELRVGHLFEGNRIRLNASLRLKKIQK